MADLREHYPVVIVGGGQAGLATSHELKRRGVAHVVLEKHGLAYEWRERRWDSFCLVTPNWQCRLPGYPYQGDDPFGFMSKDQIVEYIEGYARSFGPPLLEGVAVTRLCAAPGGGYRLETSAGGCSADAVVLATGGYHVPIVPRMAERLPRSVLQLHSAGYKNAQQLPPGEILVVGSGQSGAQIAEDLHLAGRTVHLCVGSAPRTARRYRGRDVVAWLEDMGHYTLPVSQHPLKEGVRAKANHYVTGRDGGRDIDLRQHAMSGMQLYGRLIDIASDELHFGDDLERNLDQADRVADAIKDSIDNFIQASDISAPTEARYRPVWRPSKDVRRLALSSCSITSVIWCTGFSPDYRWVEVPIFDGKGYPVHERGVTSARGLYVIGLPWLYTWGSGRFSGVAVDASHVASHAEELTRPALSHAM